MIYNSFNEAYVELLKDLLAEGHEVTARKDSSLGSTREILAADFGIPAIMPLCTLTNRKLSYAFALLEPFYLFTNQYDTDIATALMAYAPNLKELAYNENTGKFDGNYGDRIHLMGHLGTLSSVYWNHLSNASSQLIRAFNVISQDQDSRRAVVTIHNPVFDYINSNSRDIPCTLSLQFMIRNRHLHCFCTMRSNDIWYGTPHNVMMFTFLQRALAGWLHIEPGMYFHRANSLHIYEKHIPFAEELLRNQALNDQSPKILYPCHKDPTETYRRALEMIKWEKRMRESVNDDFADAEPHEKLVMDHVRTALKMRRSK